MSNISKDLGSKFGGKAVTLPIYPTSGETYYNSISGYTNGDVWYNDVLNKFRKYSNNTISNFDGGETIISIPVFETNSNVEVATSNYFVVPSELNGYKVKNIVASVYNKAVSGATNNLTVGIKKLATTGTTSVDILNATVSINVNLNRSGVSSDVNTSNNTLTTHDLLYVFVGSVPTNNTQGLSVSIIVDQI